GERRRGGSRNYASLWPGDHAPLDGSGPALRPRPAYGNAVGRDRHRPTSPVRETAGKPERNDFDHPPKPAKAQLPMASWIALLARSTALSSACWAVCWPASIFSNSSFWMSRTCGRLTRRTALEFSVGALRIIGRIGVSRPGFFA